MIFKYNIISDMEKSLHVFELDDGEQHWYVGTSVEEVRQFHMGLVGEEYDMECEIKEIDDSRELRIAMDYGVPESVEIKSCKEWVDDCDYEKHGVVCIASTCY